MAHIPEDNTKLLQQFVGFAFTLVARQKASEIALTRLGLSSEHWQASLDEAYASLKPISIPESDPLEGYLEQLKKILVTP
jgi:hypothetical protein